MLQTLNRLAGTALALTLVLIATTATAQIPSVDPAVTGCMRST